MPQGRNARARQGAPGGAVERGRERRLGLTSLYCDPSDISGEARRAWEAEWEWRGAAADPEKLSGGKQSLQASIFKMTTPNKTPPGADPKQLERTGTVREIGSQAVWSLSSCKPGFGVDQLRDDNLETYWQSDGSQPHLVNIQFRRKTTVKTLCIYADYKSDESYTPSKISVRVGNNFHNLQEIRYFIMENFRYTEKLKELNSEPQHTHTHILDYTIVSVLLYFIMIFSLSHFYVHFKIGC
ncbi:anaphase-promoting complex subunit 10 isoform X2 [Bubalus kerabau]|uniref:anaphase-promoting complex subunit 10 isoform X2 n=1 Tax=Bubalus bubalis TaxID=89462 RepID=UPI001E1B817F|nr:anaphase-promoting complex subunit 10 isoform X2 [Bubalus bubalis]XP_055405765.1 anaphase-promoting complex subunit 10 isoform X2 [Bubalus carabanensis]